MQNLGISCPASKTDEARNQAPVEHWALPGAGPCPRELAGAQGGQNPRRRSVSQGSRSVPRYQAAGVTKGKNLLEGFLKELEPEHGFEEVGKEVLSADSLLGVRLGCGGRGGRGLAVLTEILFVGIRWRGGGNLNMEEAVPSSGWDSFFPLVFIVCLGVRSCHKTNRTMTDVSEHV